MARYIDANMLVAQLEDEIVRCNPPFGSVAYDKSIAYGTTLGLRSAIAFASTLRTADVVEVVRCRDCKHYVAGDEMFASHCRLYGAQADDDDFCSYGERREEQ